VVLAVVLVSGGAALAAAGCAAIAGIEDAHLATTVGEAGADSGPAPDATPDGGFPVLPCTGWSSPTDLVLQSLQSATGSRTFSYPLAVFQVSQTLARVLAGQPGVGLGVYTIDTTGSTPQVLTATFTPLSARILGLSRAIRVTGGILAVGPAVETSEAGSTYLLGSVFVPDSFTGQGALPVKAFGASGLVPSSPNAYLHVNLLEMAANDYFYHLMYEVQSDGGTSYSKATGRTVNDQPQPAAQVYAQGLTQKSFNPSSAIVTDGTSVYNFVSNDPSTMSDQVQQFPAVPNGTAQSPHSLGVSGSSAYAVIGAGARSASSASVINIGGLTVDTATTTAQWRVGQIAATRLPAFTLGDVAAGDSVASLNQVVFNNVSGQWVGDNLVALGKGPATNIEGFNFYWLDANGNERAKQVGDPAGKGYGILSDHKGTLQASATLAQVVTNKFAVFGVAWTEQAADGAGVYHVLKSNALLCTQ
jgi:hypothetical protein